MPKVYLSAFLAVFLCACQTTPPQVERIDPNSEIDLSGEWNDVDSRLVSSEMVEDMLSRAWLSQHMQKYGKEPAVIVGYVRNLSHEHISVQTFTNDIERELINSGRVLFVANKEERTQIRDERLDQDINASDASRKAMGEELGADYMLIGSINTIIDSGKKERVTFYQVDLKLISLLDNRTSWIGQKKIKKIIQKRRSRY